MIVDPPKIARGLQIPVARASKWYPSIVETMERYAINTPQRLAAFLANMAYETKLLTRLIENMNYSATRLLVVFRHHFNENNAEEYAHRPERIANRVYANRFGNGSEGSGDGWRYRGRGGFHLTFKDNYIRYGVHCGKDLLVDPDAVATVELGCDSAGWFWVSRGLNGLADDGETAEIVRRISGSVRTFKQRSLIYNRMLGEL